MESRPQVQNKLFKLISVRNCLQLLLNNLPEVYAGVPVESIVGDMINNEYVQSAIVMIKNNVPITTLSALIFFTLRRINDDVQSIKAQLND